MTRKIFKNLILLSVGMLLLTAAVVLVGVYRFSAEAIFAEMQEETSLIESIILNAGIEGLEQCTLQKRLTLIAADGTVLYDNCFDKAALPNHADREEVQKALAEQEGMAQHYSYALLRNTLYYARLLPNGQILRLACAHSTEDFLLQLLYPMLGILLLVIILSAFLAYHLAHWMVRPINKIRFDEPQQNYDAVYPELRPFLRRIQQQNQIIQQQNQKMRQHQQTFSVITGNMSEGFILMDNQGNVISYNASALTLLHMLPDANGRCILNQNNHFWEAASAALCGQRREQLVNIQERCCQLIATPVIHNGQLNGAVLVILDVTEKEQRERLRRDFTANVSHELKTPLTSISGFAEIIRDGLTDAAATREFAGDIYNESQRMIVLVRDIIRLSALDEGELEQEKEQVDLYALTLRVMEQLLPAAEKRGITFHISGASICIAGVNRILEEIIYNLCDNAVKYNRLGGKVEIRIEATEKHVIFAVADTGIGIPQAAQSRVFERFYRVDKSHSRAIGGTGLGLSIVKHGAARHHAEIQLHSEEGKGTEIKILFPLTRI